MSALCEAPAETGRLEWQEKDVFVVPSWYWHAHSNESAEPATLSAPSDETRLRGSTGREGNEI
jgi:gentisate 1,2-dioxygenase